MPTLRDPQYDHSEPESEANATETLLRQIRTWTVAQQPTQWASESGHGYLESRVHKQKELQSGEEI